MNAPENDVERDEGTDPDPRTITGEPAGGEHDGAPTAEELRADKNLYPVEETAATAREDRPADHSEEG